MTAELTQPRPVVLACEDEDRIVELLRMLTEPLGVELVAAGDGASALEELAARRPALMTLDLVMPHLDGFGVLERIRQRPELDDMPIIVISALSDVHSIKRAYGYGVVDYVAKPFNIDLLDAKLKVFLRMRKLQDDLKRQKQFLEAVVDHLSSGLLVVDGEGRIATVNPAGAAQLGLAAEALVGRAVTEVLPGAEAMFRVAGDAAQRAVTVQTPAGPRSLGFTNAVLDVAGAPGTVTVFRLLDGEGDGQATRSFAHEVRNPLAAIAAAAQVVARPDCAPQQRARLAKAIEGEATRVTRLLEEYVERRRLRANPTAVDVEAMLAEVVDVNLLGSPARERISITCESGLPPVKADGAQLKQVILNLVLNAVNATAQAGTIELTAAAQGGGVALRVRDSGHGIAAQDLPRIFDESFSTRGGGLGLAIARRIVEAHGGAIRVESAEGCGATFTVWLPSASAMR